MRAAGATVRAARGGARRVAHQPMTFFKLTPVIATVTARNATTSTIHTPASPTSACSARCSRPPSMPPSRPAAANAVSSTTKYAHAAPPSVAIMRGTLISRNTIAATSAISTTKNAAPIPNSACSANAVAPPTTPVRDAGATSATPSSIAKPSATMPAISRFQRAVALALRRTRAIAVHVRHRRRPLLRTRLAAAQDAATSRAMCAASSTRVEIPSLA